MAKRSIIDSVAKDTIKPIGVGLRKSEIEALETIGIELGQSKNAQPIARNALMRIAIQRFLEAYEAGEITLIELADYFEWPDKPKAKLKF